MAEERRCSGLRYTAQCRSRACARSHRGECGSEFCSVGPGEAREAGAALYQVRSAVPFFSDGIGRLCLQGLDRLGQGLQGGENAFSGHIQVEVLLLRGKLERIDQ